MKTWIKAVISIAIPQAVAGIGAYFTVTNVGSWYKTINKPSWNPPDWVFGPVWTILYVLMGISFFLVWKSTSTKKETAIWLWYIQLFLNLCWSIIFFNQHMIGFALAELIVLWLFILLTIIAFSRINKVAAWLLVPYISWVTFAGILNYAIYQLN